VRFLWNRLPEAERAEYAISKKFIPNAKLRRRAVAMKTANGTEWLADLPAHPVKYLRGSLLTFPRVED
jgi:hypothetical protein